MTTKAVVRFTLLLLLKGITAHTGTKVIFKTNEADHDAITYPQNYNKNDAVLSSNRTCNCVAYYLCHHPPNDGSGMIDIRIVTTPPSGVSCTTAQVYCCIIVSPQTTVQPPHPTRRCGTRTPLNLSNYKLQPGQASYGKYPWSALILTYHNEYVGGGVLIGPAHLLTAAHKIQPYINTRKLKVRLGDWDIGQDLEPYGYQEYGFTNIAIHPNFNQENLKNDIAVITLSKKVPLGVHPNINAACLAPKNTDFSGNRCWVAGWGKNAFGSNGQYQDIVKEASVPILSSADCASRLQETRLGNYFQLDPNSFICAGGESGYDACTGDGGSAMVCDINGLYHVAGIVAWGIGCGDNGVPGVYTNVNNYQDWIVDQVSQD